MAAHKHAELIKVWAEGAEILGRPDDCGQWIGQVNPGWYPDWEYRIKPAEPKRAYPVTNLSSTMMARIYRDSTKSSTDSFSDVAEAVIRDLIDAGQVVTREEFDRMCGDRKARDMAVARAVAERVAEGIKASLLIGANDSTFDLHAIIAEVKP